MSLAEDLARAAGSAESVEAFYGAALEYFCGTWAWPFGQAFHVRESPKGRVLVPTRIWRADDRGRLSDIRRLTEEVTLTPDRGLAPPLPGQALQSGNAGKLGGGAPGIPPDSPKKGCLEG